MLHSQLRPPVATAVLNVFDFVLIVIFRVPVDTLLQDQLLQNFRRTTSPLSPRTCRRRRHSPGMDVLRC